MAKRNGPATLYREAVIDHNRAPRNYCHMVDATHRARGVDALCGEDIHVYLRVSVARRIEAVSFFGDASAIAMASASMMTEHIRGMSVAQAVVCAEALQTLFDGDMAQRERLGELAVLEGVRAYPSRIKSAMLAWRTMVSALTDQGGAATE